MRVYGTLVFVLWSFATAVAQNTPEVCRSTAQQSSVTSLRALNTAEMGFDGQHRRFASVPVLLSDTSAKKYLSHFGSASDPLPGYTLHSVVSSDGKEYVITVTKMNGSCAGFGATTYEEGVISLLEPLR